MALHPGLVEVVPGADVEGSELRGDGAGPVGGSVEFAGPQDLQAPLGDVHADDGERELLLGVLREAEDFRGVVWICVPEIQQLQEPEHPAAAQVRRGVVALEADELPVGPVSPRRRLRRKPIEN